MDPEKDPRLPESDSDIQRRSEDVEKIEEGKLLWNIWANEFSQEKVPEMDKTTAIDYVFKPGMTHEEVVSKSLPLKWVEELNNRKKDVLIIMALPGHGKTAMVEEVANRLNRPVRYLFFDEVLDEYLVSIDEPIEALFSWQPEEWQEFWNFYIKRYEAARGEAQQEDKALLVELVGVLEEDQPVIEYFLATQDKARFVVLNADPKASEMEKKFRKKIDTFVPSVVVEFFQKRFGVKFEALEKLTIGTPEYRAKMEEVGKEIKFYYAKMASMEAINFLFDKVQREVDKYIHEEKIISIPDDVELPYPKNEDYGWRHKNTEVGLDETDWITRYFYYQYLFLKEYGFDFDSTDVVMNPFNRKGVKRKLFVGLDLELSDSDS